jgi:hypothetical protein
VADPDEPASPQEEALFMTTEHYVLQTARSGAIQEANGRADLFITAVSGATVALGFVAQVTGLGVSFLFFALIILPPLYFIGAVSFARAVQIAVEDMVHARGMARIRRYFVERAPMVRRYLTHTTHDDYAGMVSAFGVEHPLVQSFMTTAGMVNMVSGVLAGVFSGLACRAAFSLGATACTLVGVGAFAVSIALWRGYQVRAWARAEERLSVLFPSQDQPSVN